MTVLLRNAEHNGRLLLSAGVRWARDVGAPAAVDPHDGRRRALSLGVWDSFPTTTRIPRFTGAEGRAALRARRDAAWESIRIAHGAGVRIATGTDFGGGSARANHLAWEVESLVDAGLEPWEALAAATWRGGAVLGEAEAGVIREGGAADFFLVHGDPLSDPSSLWRVWRIARE